MSDVTERRLEERDVEERGLYALMASEMARYNRWQNEALYRICDDIGEAARHRDRRLFFDTIHRTLNHVLYVDLVLLDYAELGRPPRSFEPRKILHEDWQELTEARRALDRRIEELVDRHDEVWFAREVRFQSERLGRERIFPRAFVLTQMFNHQTHHRSQVTTALHRMGVDYGITDLPWNPFSRF